MSQLVTSNIEAATLGQLLLMQSVLCGLPDERSIFGFACRGLSLLPGVKSAQQRDSVGDNGDVAFPVCGSTRVWGEVVLDVASPELFAPYESYVRNFIAMVALIMDERAERALNRQHKEELETSVRRRTQQLTDEIGERRGVEEALRRSRDMLALTLDAVPQAIFWKDATGRYLGANSTFARAAGLRDSREIVGKFDDELPWRPEDVAGYRERDRRVLQTGKPERNIVEQLRRADGSLRWVETTKVPLLDATGAPYAVLGVFEDVTDRRRAEQERESLRNQLAQAQKMESVGRLAGGVAHDFNNMLQAILGNAGLALLQPDLPPGLRDNLQEILKAAQRSASLTQQLLAFARKQTVSPRVLVLNETVASVLKMLERLIGESIRMVWQPGEALWSVRIDPVQVDQVLANLVVNARDAIQGTGTIVIATQNVSFQISDAARPVDVAAGDYVALTVIDSGIGLSAEARLHLFEPFFTTKPAGQGTGLGLATVYGIVKQNHGTIAVDSAPGAGTKFTVYLPRAEAKAITVRGVAASFPRQQGSETLLLVEDEMQILTLAKRILEMQGYTVLAAPLPEEAVKIAETFAGEIHLLITDVIMPGMNGRELYKRVAKIKSGLRCLFISGYTADVLARQSCGTEKVHFQGKPFTPEELTAGIRKALAAPPPDFG